MDLVQHESNREDKYQPQQETQAIAADPRRDEGTINQRERMVYEVDKKRGIDQVGDSHRVAVK